MTSLCVTITPAWTNVIDDNGDIDILPLGEKHERGSECTCEPTVEVIGANLLITHNSFDKREIIEQAIAILNNQEIL